MKKYKLIKEYPNSPKIGTLIEMRSGTNMYFWGGLEIRYPDNFPEFWEEIKDEYPKIVAFKSLYEHENGRILWYNDNGICIKVSDDSEITNKIDFKTALQDPKCEIYQVATSPTDVWSVADRVKYTGALPQVIKNIEKFSISSRTGKILVHFKEDLNYLDGFKLELLNKYKYYKESLFTTLDNIEIFDGDSFWFVDSFFEIGQGKCTNNHTPIKGIKEFSTREKAEEYIKQNKPKFSIKDVETALNLADMQTIVGIYSYYINKNEFKQKLGI